MRNALSMEYVAAIRSTDSRVRLVQTRLIETNWMHVQNRTKTVPAKAKAPERRAKFDPDEARSEKGDSPASVVFASCVESGRF